MVGTCARLSDNELDGRKQHSMPPVRELLGSSQPLPRGFIHPFVNRCSLPGRLVLARLPTRPDCVVEVLLVAVDPPAVQQVEGAVENERQDNDCRSGHVFSPSLVQDSSPTFSGATDQEVSKLRQTELLRRIACLNTAAEPRFRSQCIPHCPCSSGSARLTHSIWRILRSSAFDEIDEAAPISWDVNVQQLDTEVVKDYL